jgi:hypothetical protein
LAHLVSALPGGRVKKCMNTGCVRGRCQNCRSFGLKWQRMLEVTGNAAFHVAVSSVADPDPVGPGPFWSDPNVWDRIRILALINDHISTF